MLRILCLALIVACAAAFQGPVARAAPRSQVNMALGRREAALAAFAGLAALTTGAEPSSAGLPEFVRCPAPEGTCEAWKKDKKPSPTFAEVCSSFALRRSPKACTQALLGNCAFL